MKLIYNKENVKGDHYDKRGLVFSQSGLHRYPSKKMFVDFLEKYKDVKGSADIWSEQDNINNQVIIHVELKYSVPDMSRCRHTYKNAKTKFCIWCNDTNCKACIQYTCRCECHGGKPRFKDIRKK
jgi:hypothetical protein